MRDWSVATDCDFEAETAEEAGRLFIAHMREPGPHTVYVWPIQNGVVTDDAAHETEVTVWS